MGDLSDQINEMLGEYKEEKDEVEEPEVIEEPEEVVEEDEEPTEEHEEVEEEEPVEEPEREPIEDEEGGEEEEIVEDEDEEDEIAALRAQINAQNELLLKHGIGFSVGEEDEGEAPRPGATQETPPVETPSGTIEILGEDESLDDVLNDRESFVRWAQGFAQRVIQSGTQAYATRLPGVVAPQVRQIIDLNRAVDEFYSENEDLKPVRSTVGAIGRDLATKHPDWNLPKLFEESGKRARKLLKMPEPGSVPKGRRKVNPSFAKTKGGGRKPKPKVSKLQQEIDELL
jgi:hypothetical protein